ncbi:hypothetical protein MRX96_025692 [Rhipicephalus microplus]
MFLSTLLSSSQQVDVGPKQGRLNVLLKRPVFIHLHRLVAFSSQYPPVMNARLDLVRHRFAVPLLVLALLVVPTTSRPMKPRFRRCLWSDRLVCASLLRQPDACRVNIDGTDDCPAGLMCCEETRCGDRRCLRQYLL